MSELGMNEISQEVAKVQEISPESEINMSDCKQFWDDIFGNEINDSKDLKENRNSSGLTEKLDFDSAKAFWNDIFSKEIAIDEGNRTNEVENSKYDLTERERDIMKEETGWSDKIVESIGTMSEYKIYKEAGLVEGKINGKECLLRNDIDWDKTDQFGSSNRERVENGYSPIDNSGKPIELHHIGQHQDSPLAELTFEEHRTGGNDTILHDKTKLTEVHGEGSNWASERKEYWKNR